MVVTPLWQHLRRGKSYSVAVHGADHVVPLQPTEHLMPEELDAQRKLWPCAGAGSWHDPWVHGETGAHAGASLLTGVVTCSLGDPHWQPVLKRTTPCGNDSCWSRCWRTASYGNAPTGEFHGRLSLVWSKPCWRWGTVWGALPLRGKHWPQPVVPVLGEGRGKDYKVKVKSRKEGGIEGSVSKICVYFSLYNSYLIGNGFG